MVKKINKKKISQQAESQSESRSTKHHIWTNPRLLELYWLISEYKPK